MIVACKALPRSAMERYRNYHDSELATLMRGYDHLWIISVTDPTRRALYSEMGNVLPLVFEDVDVDGLALLDIHVGPSSWLFSPEQADKVCAFVRRAHASPGRDLLAVNCFAGVSRSGAIVTFAARACGVDSLSFYKMNPQIAPNRYVHRLLVEAWDRGA